MATSVKDLKARLRKFIADPLYEKEFAAWFACALRDADASDDAEFESLAHTIQEAFARAEEGEFSPGVLRNILSTLAVDATEEVNHVVVVSASVIPPSVNQLTVEQRPYRGATEVSDTSREAGFSLPTPLLA